MRITTWNVNGLRAALRKGFERHIRHIRPQVLMLQEIRALPEQLPPKWERPRRWKALWHPAERRGYAGVATLSRQPHERLGTGMDGPDPEGRILRSRTAGIHLVNVYLPSGSASEAAQARKELFMARFAPWAAGLAALDEPVIIAGDLNIAHTRDDIHNPTGNKKNSGFLPHERDWFSDLLAQGWVDVWRAAHPGDKTWTWWSNRGQARKLDRGWRLDYQLASPDLASRVVEARIQGRRPYLSDHCAVTVTYRK